MYLPLNEKRRFNEFSVYISSSDIGIREDGRKKIAMVYITLDRTYQGFYWLEGEEPIVSDMVSMDAQW